MVEVGLAKEKAVYAGKNVRRIASIAVAKQEDEGVARQERDDGRDGIAVGHRQCKKRSGTIAEGDTLQDVAFFVARKLSTLSGVRSTKTAFILKTYKENDVLYVEEKTDSREGVTA